MFNVHGTEGHIMDATKGLLDGKGAPIAGM